MRETWTAERAIADPEAWGDYLASHDDDDPVAVRVGAELAEEQAAWLATMTPPERALYLKRLEVEAAELVENAPGAPDDDPDPDGGEHLPLPMAASAPECRGPPGKANRPPGNGTRRAGYDETRTDDHRQDSGARGARQGRRP